MAVSSRDVPRGARLAVAMCCLLVTPLLFTGESWGDGGGKKDRSSKTTKSKKSKPKTQQASTPKAGDAKKASSKKSKKARRKAEGKRSRSKNGKRGVRHVNGRDISPRPMLLAASTGHIQCPPDMVAVAGRVCVDRYEMSLVDAGTNKAWTPFYTPDLTRATQSFNFYQGLREQGMLQLRPLDAQTSLPALPTFDIKPKAVSAVRVVPQGYLNAEQASAACDAAGKRLCTEAEWLTACRGEAQQDFPYGAEYEQGTCNVYRENHPSAMLHGNAARFHDDPRNNFIASEGRTLLEKTGSSPRCASKWGDDAIMDMVGNLDEWVDDPNGIFLGGFYSRGTKGGCNSRIDAHPRGYSDYSIGARCCADPVDGTIDEPILAAPGPQVSPVAQSPR